MRVRCTSISEPGSTTRWPVQLGAEYEVLGLSQDNAGWYVIFEHLDQEMPVSAPLLLFQIVDGRVPPTWNVTTKDGQLSIQPTELGDIYFMDDVQERRDDALSRYRDMKERLRRG